MSPFAAFSAISRIVTFAPRLSSLIAARMLLAALSTSLLDTLPFSVSVTTVGL